ncbi:arc-type ribbon-helix-helix [Lucifera butyrica]|uniref:Arc-type ribbon-helix-helix n=1 Tax=Lucifera butyrica TaxID=1351585 RepID=A0A498RBA2_9FIRM|nr:Arc family DNA-binding protein [Lucifera butyrica]VBB07552.1 arc-type ribbon-helix-helix [Lucifera butyrica]
MPSEQPRFTIRTDPKLIQKVRYIAAGNGRSANKEIERLLKIFVSNYEKKHGEIKFDN